MADPDYGRAVQHNPDQSWTSTYKPLWDKVMLPMNLHFDNIGWDDLVADNSTQMMTEFCTRVASHPPTSLHTKKVYSVGTLVDALCAVIRKLKEKFAPQLVNQPEMFPDADVSKWKKKLKDTYRRVLMQGSEESEVLKDIFPLPRVHSLRTQLFFMDDFPEGQPRADGRRTDMKSVSEFLFRQERFGDLAMVNLTFSGVGRAGEVKFLNYRSMMLDKTYGILFAQWFQRKNLKTNPSGFVPDYSIPTMCVFFTLGCFWACEDGLVRPGNNGPGNVNSPEGRKNRYVFLDLHAIQDSSVSSKITNIIKACIPAQIVAFFSAKSLRYGAMSHLSWDPAVTYEEAVALGGWATPSNSDYYVWIYLISIIPAVLSLAGYPDARVLPKLPRIEILSTHGPVEGRFTHDTFQAFIKSLFVINLPEFQPPHGRLRELLTTVAAVMIMHFSVMYNKYRHHHAYIKKMINATITSRMARTTTEAITRLESWSKEVTDDFKKANVQTREDIVNGQGTDVLRRRSINDQLAKMNDSVAKMLEAKIELQATLTRHQHELERVGTELTLVRATCHHVSEQANQISTQNQLIMLQNKRIMAHLGMDVDNTAVPVEMAGLPAPPNTPPTPMPAAARAGAAPGASGASPATTTATQTITPTQQRGDLEQTQLGTALQRHRGTPGNRNRGARSDAESVKNVLRSLYSIPGNPKFASMKTGASNQLEDHATWVHTNIFYAMDKTRTKIVRAVKLINALWTKEERDDIINGRWEMGDAIRNFDQIQKLVTEAAYISKYHGRSVRTPQRNPVEAC